MCAARAPVGFHSNCVYTRINRPLYTLKLIRYYTDVIKLKINALMCTTRRFFHETLKSARKDVEESENSIFEWFRKKTLDPALVVPNSDVTSYGAKRDRFKRYRT